MVVISSTTNEWPQSQAIDEKSSLTSPTSGFLMEKASTNNQEQPHPSQLHGLRCPRCDSSNTKFCYFNNYSLSQPRHFCKACKRYWTRGGTLRNVPVGGGCRKNKRFKKQPSSSSSPEAANRNTNTASTNTTAANANPSFSNHTTNTVSSGPSNLNPLFVGFDYLQPQLNSLGLGFSSTPTTGTRYGVSSDGFSSINSQLVPPSYCSPTMATLLASRFNQQKSQSLQGQPLDNGSGNFLKEVKMDWSMSYHQEEHQLGFSSDHNPLYWNSTNSINPSTNPVSSWHDPANLEGPSVSSLI